MFNYQPRQTVNNIITPEYLAPKKKDNNGNACMKYYYDNDEEKEKLNLDCVPRKWEGDFNNIENYTPSQMNDYINKYFSNDNEKFENNSPFIFPEGYGFKETEEVCMVNEFNLKPQQKFAGMFINNHTDFSGILLNHNLGSGKTCTSIVIGEALKEYNTNGNKLKGRSPFHVYIVVPKNIKDQYYEELIGMVNKSTCSSQCVINDEKQIYVTNNELRKIINTERGDLKKIYKKIDKVYKIISHDSFINCLMTTTNDSNYPKKFVLDYKGIFHNENSLIIIDEIQKLVDENSKRYSKLYQTLNIFARNNKSYKSSVKVVLLTATPVFDNPHKTALMINLLRPRIPFPTERKIFNSFFIDEKNKEMKNKLLFKYMCSGYISYFRGGSPNGYPYRINEIKLHKMQDEQETVYSTQLVKEIKDDNARKDIGTSFIHTRQISNIAYPRIVDQNNEDYTYNYSDYSNDLVKKKDIETYSKKLLTFRGNRTDILNYVKKSSNKFSEIINLILHSPGPVFVYSAYIPHGILPLVSILNALGWDFLKKSSNSGKAFTYSVWSSSGLKNLGWVNGLTGIKEQDQDDYIKFMKNKFNSWENRDGGVCKVLIGSITEGVSLKRVRQVHICEPWWNYSKIEQIVARAIRFCSHSDLDEEKRCVNVYYHASVLQSYPGKSAIIQGELRKVGILNNSLDKISVEQKMYTTADNKNKINVEFELALKESSVDCNINKNGNVIRLERMIYSYMKEPNIFYYDRTKNIYYKYDEQQLYPFIFTNKNWPPKKNNNNFEPININQNYNDIKITQIKIIEIFIPSYGMQCDICYGKKNITYPLQCCKTEYDTKQLCRNCYDKNQDCPFCRQTIKEIDNGGEKLIPNILMLENINCDIDNEYIKDKTFKELKKDATPMAWEYFNNMYKKNIILPKIIKEYNVLEGDGANQLLERLYTILSNGLNEKIMTEDQFKNLQDFIIKKEFVEQNTPKYKEMILRKGKDINPREVRDYNYVQLEVFYKKLVDPKKNKNKNKSGGTLGLTTNKPVRRWGDGYINLKNYHNSIKKYIIKKAVDLTRKGKGKLQVHQRYNSYIKYYKYPEIALVDVSVGRMTDYNNWNSADINYVLGIDSDINYINEAKRRYQSLRLNNNNKVKVMLYQANITGNCNICNQIILKNQKFSIASSQFALQYYFENDQMIKTALTTINRMLYIGGYFIGTTIDGKILDDEFKIKNGLIETHNYSIKKNYNQKKDTGSGYELQLIDQDSENYFNEYLVDPKVLIKLCKNYGFKLVEIEPFQNFEKFFDTYKQLKDYEKIISLLYFSFIFKKIKNI